MRLYIGLTYTKAELTSGVPAVVYCGPSVSACKTAVVGPVTGTTPTASFGSYLTNMAGIFPQKGRTVARNPAGP